MKLVLVMLGWVVFIAVIFQIISYRDAKRAKSLGNKG